MSNPYFFISARDIKDSSVLIIGEDYWHLAKVLRAKPGDRVGLSDDAGKRYEAVIKKIDRTSATLDIVSSIPIERRTPGIFIYLCILKKDAMEIAIQKNTEIGVDVITPVFSRRTVVDVSGGKIRERITRWQQIAYNASKQSKRGFICRISDPLAIEEIKTDDYDFFYLPFEGQVESGKSSSISRLLDLFRTSGKTPFKKIAFLIGPEGGLEDYEVNGLVSKGAVVISFGDNILRSETASFYLASIIDFLLKVSDEKKYSQKKS